MNDKIKFYRHIAVDIICGKQMYIINGIDNNKDKINDIHSLGTFYLFIFFFGPYYMDTIYYWHTK